MMMSGLNGMKEELELVQLMQNQVHYLEIYIHGFVVGADKKGNDIMHGYAFQFGTENIDIIPSDLEFSQKHIVYLCMEQN